MSVATWQPAFENASFPPAGNDQSFSRHRCDCGPGYPTAADADLAKAAQENLDSRTFGGKVFGTPRAAIEASLLAKASENKRRREYGLLTIFTIIAPLPNALLTWIGDWSRTFKLLSHMWMLGVIYILGTGVWLVGPTLIWGGAWLLLHLAFRWDVRRQYKRAVQSAVYASEHSEEEPRHRREASRRGRRYTLWERLWWKPLDS